MADEDIEMDDISEETITSESESGTSQETNFIDTVEYNTTALDTDVSMSPAPIFDKSLLTREQKFTKDEDMLDEAPKNSTWKGKYTKTGVRKLSAISLIETNSANESFLFIEAENDEFIKDKKDEKDIPWIIKS
jgi:hypothetical protein